MRCGIEAAVRQVLNGDEAGAHIIVVTRGDNDTLNFEDQNVIREFAKTYQVCRIFLKIMAINPVKNDHLIEDFTIFFVHANINRFI